MFDKIIEIKNIGKFTSFAAAGDLKFGVFNLIYADNGTGKTTLSSTVRSLSSNNPKIVVGRKTLGNDDVQSAKLLISNAIVEFKNNSWTTCEQKFEIFDSQFIVDNVFSGNIVDHDHRRNLHKFVVGEKGVAIAHKIESLDAEIRRTTSEASGFNKEVSKAILGALSFSDFLALPENNYASSLASDLEREIQSLEKSEQIRTSQLLSRLSLHLDFKKLEEVLTKTFESISSAAQSKLDLHLKSHGMSGLAWIEQGLLSAKKDECPFCSQPLTGSELIEIYKSILNKEYKSHRSELASLTSKYSKQEQTRIAEKIKSDIKTNQAMQQFWSSFINVEGLNQSISDEAIVQLNETMTGIEYLIQKKIAAKDSQVTEQEIAQIRDGSYRKITEKIDGYNAEVVRINTLIETLKAQSSTANLKEKKAQLLKLLNTPIRHSTSVKELCDKVLLLQREKMTFENEKEQARIELDNYAKGIFEKYQSSINALLSDFGATFTIADKKENYSGGKPSTTYKLCINGTKFDLEDSTNDESKPSFKNTLSEGEKSTLAFCYFLSKLRDDNNIGEKVIIFDDPLSSFDLFRREKTKQAITELASKAKQVIVFSHDRFFLRLIWDSTQDIKAKCFNLYRKGEGTSMALWDIEKETRSRYLQDYHSLVEYLENGVPNGSESAMRDVARCIRPLIEYNLHLRFPKDFKENEWLGNCIESVRNSTENSGIASLKPQLNMLSSVNDFSKRFHHRDNRNSETEPINDSELRQFVKQGFQIISGIALAHLS